MSVRVDVYKERRLVPVGFERAKDGAPDAAHPDVDQRGSLSPDFAHVASMMQGETVTVRLRRYQIGHHAKIFVKSANPAFVKVKTPATGEVPAGATADIQLEGISGADPNQTDIEVRYGTLTGPILGRLVVRCFRKRTVVITPHLITVAQTGGGAAAVASSASIARVMTLAQAIWKPYGVLFSVQATLADTVTLATAGVVSDTPYPGELATVLGKRWIPNTINVYFVPQIGTRNVLGYGYSRGVIAAHGVPNPGILLGDRTPSFVHDDEWSGNDLAHEAGHFFGLTHVDNKNTAATIRQDYWARRCLMHNNNFPNQTTDWREDLGYGQLGGRARRGSLVTHKDLTTITNDAECTKARTTIVAGPY